MKRALWATVVILLTLLLCGCSLSRLAGDTTAGLLNEAGRTFNEEADLQLARESIPPNLKLLEGLLKVVPDNRELLTNLARGWCSYSYGFMEDSDRPGDRERAGQFYQRGYEFGLRALPFETAAALHDGNLEEIEGAVAAVGADDLAPLFWSAYCLGNWVNLNLAEVAGVAELAKAEIMMRRAMTIDPAFYYGAPHLFYGFYYGARPRLLGGDPARAKEHLQQSIAISQNRFLAARLLLAQVYAVAVQDEKLFSDTLEGVIAAPPDLLPAERLANEIARQRAKKLLQRKEELF